MKVNYRYEGEYNTEKKQKISETVDYIVEKNYGETLLHSDLCKLLGYNITNDEEFKKYKSTMGKVKHILLNFGRVLQSINNVGYYILKPSQISNHCYNTYIKQARRKYDKSAFVLGRVDDTELNKDRLEELEKMKELTNALIEAVEATTVESVYYSRKAYYENLED